ncbi:MAG: hypothetical protein R3F65_25510 [bacterium]
MRALFESTLLAVARLEAAGVRPPRLTEPGHETWGRFKRKLGPRDFIELLCEDLAPAFPLPFALARWGTDPRPLDALRAFDDDTVDALITAASTAPDAPVDDWLRDRARALDLPAGGAFSDLPKMQPRYRVLELPGSAGRIAARLCGQDDTLSLDRQFTLVADTPAERVMAGLATVALRANPPEVVTTAALTDKLAAGARFDRVVGLAAHPPAEALATRFDEARLI